MSKESPKKAPPTRPPSPQKPPSSPIAGGEIREKMERPSSWPPPPKKK